MDHSAYGGDSGAPAFNAETNPKKVNLGVGVYYGDDGKIPLLECVKVAEKARLEAMPPRGYRPIEGTPAYNGAVQKLIFGDNSSLLAEGRVLTAQAWRTGIPRPRHPGRHRAAGTTVPP